MLLPVETFASFVETFVSTRLIEKSTDFHATLSRNKTPSISRMYNVSIQPSGAGKQKEIKADRNLIQRLFVAAQGGRDVDLNNILRHELSSVPRALADTNGKLHSTDKSQLQEMLTKDI